MYVSNNERALPSVAEASGVEMMAAGGHCNPSVYSYIPGLSLFRVVLVYLHPSSTEVSL